MRDFLKWLEHADLVALAIELGCAIWVLVAFTRCALAG